jgi:hypothetical protein
MESATRRGDRDFPVKTHTFRKRVRKIKIREVK